MLSRRYESSVSKPSKRHETKIALKNRGLSSNTVTSKEVQISRFVSFCDTHVMEDLGKFLPEALPSVVNGLSFSSLFPQGHRMTYL